MKVWLSALSVIIFVALNSFAAKPQPAPQVINIDQKISINAENIALGRLLRLWDQATGTHSSIPRELANQTVSVRFSSLPIDDAVRKIFQNLSVDYLYVKGQGIQVTGVSPKTPPEPATYDNNGDNGDYDYNGEAPTVVLRMKPEPQIPSPADLPDLINSTTDFIDTTPRPVIPSPFGPVLDASGRIVQLPPIPNQAPAPAFFYPVPLPPPPAGAANGPVDNNLWAPISIYPNTGIPAPSPTPPGWVPR